MRAPVSDQRILMKHGAGGRAMRRLIEECLTQGLVGDLKPGDVGLDAMDDGAAIRIGERWLVISTDSHVVQPIFFPGGDIGRLAVSGTVNDLSMMGATDVLGLTSAVVLEEGFSRDDLVRVQRSIRDTAHEAHAPIVAGDTKVMGRGEIDGIILNTTGVALTDRLVRDSGLQPGDALIVTGNVGDHGFAVMATRHDLKLEGDLASDVAPLNDLIRHVLAAGGGDVVAMKDPTRGGLSSAVHEMAAKAGVTVVLREPAVPVSDAARAASELLGIDPLNVANEGKALIGVRAASVDAVMAALLAHPLGRRAAVIGRVYEGKPSVILDTGVGRRLLVEPEGEPLPRIC
jgi:hydrogenase expression/formation protein HypE